MDNLPDILTLVPERSRIHVIKPEPEEEKQFTDTMSYLVFKWQLFAQLIYSGMEIVYTDDVPMAATDSHVIMLNPPGLKAKGIEDILELVFVMAHEVSHRILNDLVLMAFWRAVGMVMCPGGQLPYCHELMNIAQDYRINAMLVDTKIGRMPTCALYDERYSEKGFESAVEIYEKLWKDKKFKVVKVNGVLVLKDGMPGGFDIHLEPSPEQVAKDKGKREGEIVAAANLAKRMQGTIPAALQRIIDEIIEPKIPWQDHLKATMRRKAGDPRLDWRFRNRRLAGREPEMYFAKKGHRGAGLVIMVGDNSGSIDNRQVNVFAAEMAGICSELNPEMMIVLWCDAAITKEHLDVEPDDLPGIFASWKTGDGVGGGGGTSFVPVFERIRELGVTPDMMVYFTDGMGTYPPEEPPYQVIWASTTGYKYPWGEVVHVEIPA